jgi:hypothetical protein
LLCVLAAGLPATAGVAAAAEEGALAKLPVREVTVFKDGHAFVLHEGKAATNDDGDVVLDYLPTPVMGTFWPHSRDKRVKLRSVTSGPQTVTKSRKAVSLVDLLKANIGEEVSLIDLDGKEIRGKVLRMEAQVILLSNDRGVRVVPIKRIREVTLPAKHKDKVEDKSSRHTLTLDLDWGRAKPAKTAEVGMVYVQRGIRWIPNYRIDIDGKGNARIKLQATLVNDMVDLDGVTVHLVIGVPTIQFAGQIDPISFQKQVANLTRAFRSGAATGQYLSNAIMSQVAVGNVQRSAPRGGAAGGSVGDAVTGSEGREDLYVFTVDGLTLKKGRRMVVPVAEFTLSYRDVYALDVPITPPPDVWRNFNSSQRQQYMQRFHAPKVMHKIRMANKSKYPITTAPAMILRDGRLIAQGMTYYTPVGSRCDVTLTTAVNVSVKKTDREVKRTPNAMNWHGNSYARSDLEGSIELVNHTDKDIALEVTRSALGTIDSAGQDGKIKQLNTMEDPTFVPSGGSGARPWGSSGAYWWHWYSWPSWWMRLNAAGHITWKLELKAGKKAELTYKWHYFWR